MASIASKKVTPINDAAELNENDIIDPADMNAAEQEQLHTEDEVNLNVILKRATRRTYYEQFMQMMEYVTYDNMKAGMRYMLESASFTITLSFDDLTMLMTLFVLFGDDIKLLCAPKSDDNAFNVAYAICLFTFIFELLAASWTKTKFVSFYPKPQWTGYLFSFFWFLDFIAILTLFVDIPFIGKPIGLYGVSNSVSGGSNYAKAGRVVRLVRLVRLVKLYKVAAERRLRAQQDAELAELVRVGVIKYEDVAKQRALNSQGNSRLGDQLSESTTRRVIIMILIMIIILPLLLYFPDNQGREFATRMVQNFNTDASQNAATQQVVLDTFLSSMQQNYNNRYVDYLDVQPYAPLGPDSPYVYFKSNLDGVRKNAQVMESLSDTISGDDYYTRVVFNVTSLVRQSATFSILMTIFVAIMMIGGSLVFTNDAQRLVIAPIERMMNMVEAVAADPLATLHFEDDGGNEAGRYETRLLETTIEKITGLLRVGFGEAGAGIISANLSAKGSSTAINPLLPGQRIYAIFGFCDIHHFEDINRQLTMDVLVFVNRIAEIVHSSVHTWSGQCNKNLGNAFVIVWRIGDEHTLAANQRGANIRTMKGAGSTVGMDVGSTKGPSATSMRMSSGGSDGMEEPSAAAKKSVTIDLRRVPGVDILADQALIGYCKIIAEINRNKYVMRYRDEPRLTENGTHDFKVRMGFGLHAGWAIEGAVGSLQKVDATYLSPHVNMAARLETSSKQYGVPLLASQDFYDLMSNEGQAVMRRLDVVTVKGSEVPIGIFTYDALQDQKFREDKKRQRPSTGIGSDMVLPPGTSTKQPAMDSPAPNKLMNNGSLKMMGNSAPNTPAQSLPAGPASVARLLLEGNPGAETGGNGSGTGTPQRRPSISLMPGASEKAAIFLTPDDHTGDIFEQDYDMLTLRAHAVDPEFQSVFKDGIGLYLAGDWAGAKVLLEKADTMMAAAAPALGGDGPSQTLLRYMRDQNFEAPSTWKGYRPLTSK